MMSLTNIKQFEVTQTKVLTVAEWQHHTNIVKCSSIVHCFAPS